MKKNYTITCFAVSLSAIVLFTGCKKGGSDPTPVTPTPPIIPFAVTTSSVNGQAASATLYNIPVTAITKISFSAALSKASVTANVKITDKANANIAFTASYERNDSTLVLLPSTAFDYLTGYNVSITGALASSTGRTLGANQTLSFNTGIDSTSKFPQLSDDQLLDKIQQQTFKYFWDFGHPISGLARERSNGDNEVITSGGSGFGIMAMLVGIERSFITRAQALDRLNRIVGFLKDKAQKFHGAFPHWLNGTSGQVIPFSEKDNGADLVETSYLMQGLLCARQYFNGSSAIEVALRTDINNLYNGVEWDWFRKGSEEVLYWHWSPTNSWDMNLQIRGWNECLVTYLLAASSTKHGVPKVVYSNGWAGNPGFINGTDYYGYKLPLGPDRGGPLFFSHYSFLGIDPTGLTDTYANYAEQTKNHTLINYSYCVANPNNNFGYSNQCWGLTASDIPNGYTASSPTNDVGVIAPTAAIASYPYTPQESMNAMKFFYYTLGDKLWKEYGFVDAFSLKELWFANSFLAIDQGPVIVMIENKRSGLLWNLFTSCPEIKTGMRSLGFTAPYL